MGLSWTFERRSRKDIFRRKLKAGEQLNRLNVKWKAGQSLRAKVLEFKDGHRLAWFIIMFSSTSWTESRSNEQLWVPTGYSERISSFKNKLEIKQYQIKRFKSHFNPLTSFGLFGKCFYAVKCVCFYILNLLILNIGWVCGNSIP